MMQVNSNYKSQTTRFGMAFRRPEGHNMSKLSDYLGLENKINRKGFAQYIREMKKCKNYDVEFWPVINIVKVIEAKTNQVVGLYPGSSDVTGIEHLGVARYPARRLFAQIFDPKQYLPYNFLQAAKRVEKLEAEVAAKNTAANFINKTI